jgi:CBS domain containing-hemolysin-like protein
VSILKKMKQSIVKTINWSLGIAVITLVLAAIFSVVSTYILSGVAWATGMVIVFIIVLIGIFFDTIGVAATAANETPFHAMASKRMPGAKHAVQITRNADKFANFCNDVIGDIAGIISGTATAFVVLQLTLQLGHMDGSMFQLVISVVFTSVVAAITVGGKSIGKTLAIHYSTQIIYQVGRLLYILEVKFKIKIFSNNRNKQKVKRNRK